MQALCQLSYSPENQKSGRIGKGTSRSGSVRYGRGPVDDWGVSPESLEVVVLASRRLEHVNHDVAVVEQHPLGLRPALVTQWLSARLLEPLLNMVCQGLSVRPGIPGGYHKHLGDHKQVPDFQQDDVLALLVGYGVCCQPGKCHC